MNGACPVSELFGKKFRVKTAKKDLFFVLIFSQFIDLQKLDKNEGLQKK